MKVDWVGAAAEAAIVQSREAAALAGDQAALDLMEGYLRARRWRRQTSNGWRDPLDRPGVVPVLSAARMQIGRDLRKVQRPIERRLARAANSHCDE